MNKVSITMENCVYIDVVESKFQYNYMILCGLNWSSLIYYKLYKLLLTCSESLEINFVEVLFVPNRLKYLITVLFLFICTKLLANYTKSD